MVKIIEFLIWNKKIRNNEEDKETINDNEVTSPQVKSSEQSHDDLKENPSSSASNSAKTQSVPFLLFY